jgi:preprotein translocase subunit YajC
MEQTATTTATTTTATPPAAPQGNMLLDLIPFAFIFVVFYFLIIRPQQKKFKQHQALVSSIKKGDKVVLSSGIIGNVTKAETPDGVIDVEIAPSVVVKVVAATISSVNAKNQTSNDNSKAA